MVPRGWPSLGSSFSCIFHTTTTRGLLHVISRYLPVGESLPLQSQKKFRQVDINALGVLEWGIENRLRWFEPRGTLLRPVGGSWNGGGVAKIEVQSRNEPPTRAPPRCATFTGQCVM